LIQTMLAFSIWIGFGLESLISLLMDQWRHADRVLIPLLILFLFLRINSVFPKVNAFTDARAETFGQLAMTSIPENALVFTRDDQTTFALWYFHFALGKRPDLNVIPEGLLTFDWYRQNLQTTYPSLKIPKTAILSAFTLINQNPDRPYCFVEYTEKAKINCSRSNT
jgi:hypothetical protein